MDGTTYLALQNFKQTLLNFKIHFVKSIVVVKGHFPSCGQLPHPLQKLLHPAGCKHPPVRIESSLETTKLKLFFVIISSSLVQITGNWAEHLLDFDKITKITRKNNFQVKIMPGFLPFSFLFLRRIKRNFLNIIWSLFPNLGLSYSPFYLVFGKSNFK